MAPSRTESIRPAIVIVGVATFLVLSTIILHPPPQPPTDTAEDAATSESACEKVNMGEVKKRRASSIVGKRIVKVEMCAHVEDNGHGGDRRTMHNPRITLEDGTKIVFMVEEHPMGAEYGVDLLVFR